MSDNGKTEADCYSAADRGLMAWTRRVRARLLWPLLALLGKCNSVARCEERVAEELFERRTGIAVVVLK